MNKSNNLGQCSCQRPEKKEPELPVNTVVASGYSKKSNSYFVPTEIDNSGHTKKRGPMVDERIHTPEVEVIEAGEEQKSYVGTIAAGLGWGLLMLIAASREASRSK